MQIGKPGNIGFPDSASLQNRNHALEINARFLIHMTEKFPQIVIHKQHRHIFGNNRQSREETAFFPQTAPKSVFLPQNRVFDISFLAKIRKLMPQTHQIFVTYETETSLFQRIVRPKNCRIIFHN